MKKRNIAKVAAGGIAVAGVAAGAKLYGSRFKTMASIKQVTRRKDEPFNLYRMDVRYAYDLDRIIARGVMGDQENIDAILKEAMPLAPVRMEAPQFGCSAFTLSNGEASLMGRNYDFKLDTSAMMVHCAPADGYESIGFCALNNLSADAATNPKARFACLAAPFTCIDGINEAGVSIAVLTLDSLPTRQFNGQPVISTPLAVRLVLDRASTTQEAIGLLESYDMFATSGRDYHFYITDATGDGCVVEYDCDDANRRLTITPARSVTNFYAMHADKVAPNQKNGPYGHGRERQMAIEEALSAAPENEPAVTTAWHALQAAAQDPNPEDITSNTQWSIVFDNESCTASIATRRNWNDLHLFDIHGNER